MWLGFCACVYILKCVKKYLIVCVMLCIHCVATQLMMSNTDLTCIVKMYGMVWVRFIFWVPLKAFCGCGWKVLDLPLFILNKSDSSPHLRNLYSHLHWGLLDVNMSLCVAFLSAQASEFDSF